MFSAANNPEPLAAKKVRPRLPWIFLALILLLVVGVRWRLRDMPLERDEGEYAYAGQLILQGIPPYKLVYNMKLPGTYASYALLMAVFGQSPSGIHVGLVFVNVAAIVLVFLLARKILDDLAGAGAAVAYGLMTLSPSVLGLQAHATHFVVVPALGGALVLLGAAHTRRRWRLFASGLLLGLAFVMKQHGALFGVFGFSYLIWATTRVAIAPEKRRRHGRSAGAQFRLDWRKCGPAWSVFGLGLAVPYLLTCAVLWSAGVSGPFLFWTISYANKYITAVPLANASEQFHSAINLITSANLFFWLLAVLGAVVMWWEKRLERARFFVVALFVCSGLSISIGFYFREHYFILLLPAVSLLAGIAVSRGMQVLKQERTLELIPAVLGLGLFVVGVGSEVLTNSSYWFEFSPVKACRQIYGSTLFPEAVRVAEFVRTNTPPQATIAVIGSEPEIYFYARRHSATGYIYMYPLMEWHSYAQKMQEEMIREIEAARPEYVVFVKDGLSWLQKPSSRKRLFEWWPDYAAANYESVRTVDIEAEKYDDGGMPLADSAEMFSGNQFKNPKPADTGPVQSGQYFIFRRKDSLKNLK